MYEKNFKRMIDLILSIIATLVLSPVLIITYFLVIKKHGKPAIFRQERIGLDNKKFTIYKFKTMINSTDSSGRLLEDKYRRTKFGNKLRDTSIDELPELFNIIKGDMSFVGPRPLHVKYLDRYTEEQIKRHQVRPGLTGLAQIKGRNTISWDEKFEWDLEYKNNITLLKDLRIIFLTVKQVLKKQDVDISSDVTMPEFMGNLKEKGLK